MGLVTRREEFFAALWATAGLGMTLSVVMFFAASSDAYALTFGISLLVPVVLGLFLVLPRTTRAWGAGLLCGAVALLVLQFGLGVLLIWSLGGP